MHYVKTCVAENSAAASAPGAGKNSTCGRAGACGAADGHFLQQRAGGIHYGVLRPPLFINEAIRFYFQILRIQNDSCSKRAAPVRARLFAGSRRRPSSAARALANRERKRPPVTSFGCRSPIVPH
ncbi:hypothetical protein EVAR_26008_1 [Eumeta japonica]|uniref:Uncharacterized protein n=1 Tax=Eumeta variegata TaxID=151549 RepID=A0A4C1VP89_EUMVA|nr:hypothetical protein EVAR_26008_1 [Eumeta japonica]